MMIVTLQNDSGILNSMTGINAAEPRQTLCKPSSKAPLGADMHCSMRPKGASGASTNWVSGHDCSLNKGHEATDTGLAYAPVSQVHGHNHIVQCFSSLHCSADQFCTTPGGC